MGKGDRRVSPRQERRVRASRRRVPRMANTISGYERLKDGDTLQAKLKDQINQAFEAYGLVPLKVIPMKRWRKDTELIAGALWHLKCQGLSTSRMATLFNRDVSVIARMVREHMARLNAVRTDPITALRLTSYLTGQEIDALQRYVDARSVALRLMDAPCVGRCTSSGRILSEEEVRSAIARYRHLFELVDSVAIQWTRQMIRLCDSMAGLDYYQLQQIAVLIDPTTQSGRG